MKLNFSGSIAWIVAILLLFLAAWCFNIAVYNWWSAGFFHGTYQHAYGYRGNTFFAVGASFLILFVLAIVAIRRANKKEHIRKK